MFKLLRTTSSNPDFIELIKHLDAYLSEKDGDEHSFYDQFNKVDAIKHVVVAYEKDVPISCGAIKELEHWAGELSYHKCILETGKRQTEAIALYKKNGYQVIPNYGQYAGVENSICFEKELK
jgi:putative acetyltransferase